MGDDVHDAFEPLVPVLQLPPVRAVVQEELAPDRPVAVVEQRIHPNLEAAEFVTDLHVEPFLVAGRIDRVPVQLPKS